jgi:glycosyltransferase involved in cell wall biosynthesis
MRVLILHRYNVDEAIGTNASLIPMLTSLSNLAEKVVYLSYKGINNKPNNIIFESINLKLNRGSSLDKIIKSLLWLILSPIKSFFLVRKYNIDFIYCDDSLPYYPYLIKLIIQRKKCKVVMRLGDLQTGYIFANQGFFHRIAFKLFHSLEVYVWNNIDGIIPISYPMKNYLLLNKIKNNMPVVKESINMLDFCKKKSNVLHKFGINENDIVVMFHGALEKAKGVDVLVNAASIMEQTHNNLKFVIVGNGTEYGRIKTKVLNMGLSNVILTGWVNFKEMPEYINSSDIGIALRSDNMGNNFVVTTALMQYLACEKPLIVPELEATKEIINDSKNGVFYTPGSPESLVSNIEKIISYKHKWKEMGRLGRETVQENFSHYEVGMHMSQVLHDLHLKT